MADIAGAAAPAERARRRGADRRAVHVQAQRRPVEGAHHVRPAAGRKGRSLDRDERPRRRPHPPLQHPRFQQQHVLAVHRAAHGLLEDPAVLPGDARADPGLHREGAAQIERPRRRERHPAPGAKARGAVARDRPGLREGDPRLVAAGKLRGACINGAG